MQNQLEKTKSASSTIEVQNIIYERHLKAIERRQGEDRSKIIEQINNPEIYKKVTKIKRE
jgi:hypothetical protein